MGANSIAADCHMHTHFSSDSEASPEAMIKEALRKGLESICITDHYDPKCLDCEDIGAFDPDEYFKELQPLKEKYKDKIDINIGIELGMQPDSSDEFNKLLLSYPFEFVIGSTHAVEKRDPSFGYDFERMDDESVYQKYLEEELKNIKCYPGFHVLGHMDYVIRYGKEMERSFHYKNHYEVIDDILKELIYSGRGLEINSSGLKYGLPYPHPGTQILKRYRELGGDIITFGSDAHCPLHICYDFKKAAEYAKNCNVKYYTIFKDGNKEFYQLP